MGPCALDRSSIAVHGLGTEMRVSDADAGLEQDWDGAE